MKSRSGSRFRWNGWTRLRTQFPGVSRGTIQRLLGQGHIRVNGRPANPSHHPPGRPSGQRVLAGGRAAPSRAGAEDIPLDILYEDEDLLALNKPAGLVVHPAAGHPAHTLVNALLHHCAGQLSGIGGVARPGIVHRLDKDTSGCLVVAKNDAAHLHLSGQFAARAVEKTYEAIICGQWPGPGGEVDAPIARHRLDRKRMAAGAVPAPARTTFRVLEWLRGATRVEVDFAHRPHPSNPPSTSNTSATLWWGTRFMAGGTTRVWPRPPAAARPAKCSTPANWP